MTQNFTSLNNKVVKFDPFAGPEIVRVVPSTEPQREIWIACLLGSDDANRAYNESVSLRFKGALDRVAMEQAVLALVRQHDALRSIFSADGQYLCIYNELIIDFLYQDYSEEAASSKEELVHKYVREDVLHLFNLVHGPLFKTTLIKLTDDEYCLVVTAHHIICDGWSMGILLQDISTFYSAYVQNNFPVLPEAMPFSRYADEQIQFHKTEKYQQIVEFWVNQYKDQIPVLELPTDFSRPSLRTYKSSRLDYPIDGELVVAIKKMGSEAGCSFVTTLLAAFEVLLHQLTSQEVITVGLPTAGQSLCSNQRLIGHCVHLVPLRSHITEKLSFLDFLKLCKESILDAYEHQQLTFGSLLKQMVIPRNASRIPLIPVVFNVDMGIDDDVDFHALTYQLSSNPREYENFELFINVSGSGKSITLEWSYNTQLFKAGTIDRMMADFNTLLKVVVANPAVLLNDVKLRPEHKPEEKLTQGNDTDAEYPRHTPLHALIAQAAIKYPDKVALLFNNQEVSYRVLNESANQLAHYLIHKGVRVGEVVGVAVERSPEMLISLLAVMKAGAAYLPIDLEYPQERITFMLDDSSAKMLIISQKQHNRLNSHVTKILIENALLESKVCSKQEPDRLVSGDDLSYVSYTSGSNGKPKGVLVEHRNLVNFIWSMKEVPGIGKDDVLLAVTTILFDIAGLELYLPLVAGATILMADATTVGSIVDLFEAQTLASPNAIAVVYENQELSYKELNQRSNQLARYLNEQGVGCEMLVPICVERSLEMIVGILGILKAGGAYVPIDPAYPADRISYMLEDTGAALVVSSRQGRVKLQNTAAKVIVLDDDWPLSRRQDVDNLPKKILPDKLAYVIYTSGSTGRPKGVLIEHKSLVASTLSRNSYYPTVGSALLLSSYAFDSSVALMFGTLSTGGSLILCKDELIKDVDHIRKLLSFSDSILCVPSYYNFLLEEKLLAFSPVSRVIVAGEKLNQALVNLHYQETVDVALYNEYGPTENTVWATVAKIKSRDDLITIGKPIINVNVYILDEQKNSSPIGIKGELYIGGVQVARGYLNRSDLTQELFIDDPFSSKSGSRMYKTGDLGRWLPDGNIEYLGRIDDQVKIRGYRIELSEIESVLQKSGLVSQVVVLAQEERQGTNRLIGYVVAKGEFDRQQVVTHLTEKLPEYMVPALWVTLDHFPLTPNGKIDKKALAKLEVRDLSANQFVAPLNELEEKLVGLWKSLLNVERVGIQDNFFELGGHSLLAMRMVSLIRRELAVDTTIKDLFVNPTIAELAKNLENSYKKVPKSLIPLKTSGSKPPYYIVCGVGGTVFPFREFAGMMDPDQPVYGLQQPADYRNLDEFPNTIEGIAALYINEILLENPNGPYALSGHCLGGFIAFEMARQLEAMGRKVSMLAMFDTIMTEKEQVVQPAFANFYHVPAIIKKTLSNALLKINFELFLIIKHPKQALRYKVGKARLMMGNNSTKPEDTDMDVYNNVSKRFIEALGRYKIRPYNGNLLVFYAKEHYYFVDKTNKVFYKAFTYSDGTKGSWNRYAESVKIYEVDGEHSSMFEPKYAAELSHLLQQHLNEKSVLISSY